MVLVTALCCGDRDCDVEQLQAAAVPVDCGSAGTPQRLHVRCQLPLPSALLPSHQHLHHPTRQGKIPSLYATGYYRVNSPVWARSSPSLCPRQMRSLDITNEYAILFCL